MELDFRNGFFQLRINSKLSKILLNLISEMSAAFPLLSIVLFLGSLFNSAIHCVSTDDQSAKKQSVC